MGSRADLFVARFLAPLRGPPVSGVWRGLLGCRKCLLGSRAGIGRARTPPISTTAVGERGGRADLRSSGTSRSRSHVCATHSVEYTRRDRTPRRAVLWRLCDVTGSARKRGRRVLRADDASVHHARQRRRVARHFAWSALVWPCLS
jgi:hypothetical protein